MTCIIGDGAVHNPTDSDSGCIPMPERNSVIPCLTYAVYSSTDTSFHLKPLITRTSSVLFCERSEHGSGEMALQSGYPISRSHSNAVTLTPGAARSHVCLARFNGEVPNTENC
jgi:hypothetical protein